jgi:hypothetical protein
VFHRGSKDSIYVGIGWKREGYDCIECKESCNTTSLRLQPPPKFHSLNGVTATMYGMSAKPFGYTRAVRKVSSHYEYL